jgi:hypothetical protein
MKSSGFSFHRHCKLTFKLALFLLLIFIFLSFGTLACHKDNAGSNDFLIGIDSVKLPVEVNQGVSFDIHFYGTIGFSDCYSFKTFNRRLTGNEITIECYGTYEDKNGKCLERLVTMDGMVLNMSVMVPGKYIIIIKEPDSSSIVEQITVK